MFLLIIIIVRTNFICTNIVIRIILQEKYNNIFALILLKEIVKI